MHKRTVRNNGKGEREKKRKKFPTGDFLLGGKEGIGGVGFIKVMTSLSRVLE